MKAEDRSWLDRNQLPLVVVALLLLVDLLSLDRVYLFSELNVSGLLNQLFPLDDTAFDRLNHLFQLLLLFGT